MCTGLGALIISSTICQGCGVGVGKQCRKKWFIHIWSRSRNCPEAGHIVFFFQFRSRSRIGSTGRVGVENVQKQESRASLHSLLKEKSYHSRFFFRHRYFWRHDISRSDQSQHCLHTVLSKHSVCLHVSRAVSKLWPSDLRRIVWHWTLIGQSRIYFSPLESIWLYFIRLWSLLNFETGSWRSFFMYGAGAKAALFFFWGATWIFFAPCSRSSIEETSQNIILHHTTCKT